MTLGSDHLHEEPTRDAELEPNQLQILTALRAIGIEGHRVLDVGCGVGRLHRRLLDAGAAWVVGVELDAAYLERARALAEAEGIDDRTTYLEGDFTALADQLEPADVTILDKAVHCYLDPERLVRRAAAQTRSLYVLTFPQSRWWFRWLLGTAAAVVRCLPESWRPSWRVQFTDPEVIRSWVREAGFVCRSREETAIFITEVYERVE